MKSHNTLNREYGLSTMQVNSLMSSIPKSHKEAAIRSDGFTDPKFASFMSAEKTAQYVYGELEPVVKQIAVLEDRWQADLKDSSISIPPLVAIAHSATTVMKYRSFQYRLIMRAVITNVHLQRWGIIETDACTFCQAEVETYRHLFSECPAVQDIWQETEDLCKKHHQGC